MKRAAILIALAAVSLAGADAQAGLPPKIMKAVLEAYPPAIDNRALHTAYEKVDPGQMRGYAVMERGGVPAERARFFISWSDYDYRGVVIHLGEDGRMTTRRGSPYTYLMRGDVMAVTGVKVFNNTIYLKLMSADIYVPENREKEKKHSRVTVMLGFKFPKDVLKRDDADWVMRLMGGWVRPFPNLTLAAAYSSEIGAGMKVPAVAVEMERIDSLEQKIEAAKKDLEEAEKELGEIKKSKESNP